MRTYAKEWPDRVWAVEGSNGAGRPLAQRLLEDGEQVVDVPAKLAARVRLFDTGHNRKTNADDAHVVAAVAVRTKTLRVLQVDGNSKLCGCSPTAAKHSPGVGSRPSTGFRPCSQNCCLVRRNATSPPARPKRCWPAVRPLTSPARPADASPAGELAELIAVEAKIKKSTGELKTIVLARGSHLMDLQGVDPREIATNGHLRAWLVDGEDRVVGGFVGAEHMPLVRFSAGPHQTTRVPVLMGATSLDPKLGYAVPPGTWHLVAEIRSNDSHVRADPLPLLVTDQ